MFCVCLAAVSNVFYLEFYIDIWLTFAHLHLSFLRQTGKRKKASRPVLGDVLHTLSSAMSLLRRCRVNAALTIQLFSQLFHYINMYIFNRLVLEPQLKLCTRNWGLRLSQRLERIQDWAENLGLELAAECHLGRVVQVLQLNLFNQHLPLVCPLQLLKPFTER